MDKKITPEEARAYLADASNFHQNDELCYICGIGYDRSSVECDGRIFCTLQCCNQYVRIAKRAAIVAPSPSAAPVAQGLTDERAAFEKWIAEDTHHTTAHQIVGYVSAYTDIAWKAWQERAQAAPSASVQTVGEAGTMPGTDGFTMACFRAADVPVGTKLYTAPAPSASPADAEEDAYVIDRLGKLLAGVAIALKGPDLEQHRHSYHDLVEVAERIVLELDLYRATYGSKIPAEASPSPAALNRKPLEAFVTVAEWAQQSASPDVLTDEFLKAREDAYDEWQADELFDYYRTNSQCARMNFYAGWKWRGQRLAASPAALTDERIVEIERASIKSLTPLGAVTFARALLAASPADQVAPWISVDARLPAAAGEYLVYRPDAHHLPAADPNTCIRSYTPGKNPPGDRWGGAHRVSHWMPLPSAPAIRAAMSATPPAAEKEPKC